MPALRTAHRVLTWFCAIGAGTAMAAVFAIIFFNSLRRYTIGKSLAWGEELPIYLTVYGIMFGAALAYLQDRHIRFTIITEFFPRRIRDLLDLFVDILIILVGILMAYSGWLFTTRRGDVEASGIIGTAKNLAVSTGFPWLETLGHMAAWQFSMVLGGVVIALAALSKFLERLSAFRSGEA